MAQMSNEQRRKFYENALEDQRHLLRTAIEAMGKGDLTQALTVATCVRTLVHETGSSTPLLKRLRPGYLGLTIYDTPPPRPDPSGRSRHILRVPMAVNISTEEPRLSLMTSFNIAMHQLVSLGTWWTQPSLALPGLGEMSRREIFLGLANKEGAHVDADMPVKYRLLMESKQIQLKVNDYEIGPANISRLTAGASGVLLLDCLDRHFPHSS